MSEPDDIRRGALKVAWSDSSAGAGDAPEIECPNCEGTGGGPKGHECFRCDGYGVVDEVSVACRRCSGGVGLLCDQCTLEVTVAALDTIRETAWPDPPEPS